jgi:ORF6N domain-containing protein
MVDADLAKLCGLTTCNLNKAVQRNRERFPEGFMFCRTERAVQVNQHRDHAGFLYLRRLTVSHEELRRKIAIMEKKFDARLQAGRAFPR